MLVRRVRVVRGEVRFILRCAPRLDYARAETRAEASAECSVVFRAIGASRLRLVGSVPLQAERGDAVGDFSLRIGEHADFVLLDKETDAPDAASLGEALSGSGRALALLGRKIEL
jgi:hypothetical protein